jgi:hypothetical protein
VPKPVEPDELLAVIANLAEAGAGDFARTGVDNFQKSKG